jgi:hypothetical protein
MRSLARPRRVARVRAHIEGLEEGVHLHFPDAASGAGEALRRVLDQEALDEPIELRRSPLARDLLGMR